MLNMVNIWRGQLSFVGAPFNLDNTFLSKFVYKPGLTGIIQTNLQKIMSIALEYTDEVIVPGLTRINNSKAQPFSATGRLYDNGRIAEFDAVLTNACYIRGTHYVQMSNAFLPEELVDGLHPNSEGHKKIFERVMEFKEHFLG